MTIFPASIEIVRFDDRFLFSARYPQIFPFYFHVTCKPTITSYQYHYQQHRRNVKQSNGRAFVRFTRICFLTLCFGTPIGNENTSFDIHIQSNNAANVSVDSSEKVNNLWYATSRFCYRKNHSKPTTFTAVTQQTLFNRGKGTFLIFRFLPFVSVSRQ